MERSGEIQAASEGRPDSPGRKPLPDHNNSESRKEAVSVYTNTETEIVKNAECKDGRTWYIDTESSTGFGVSRERVERAIWDGFKPEPGDEVTLYCRNWSSVVGLDWKGERVFLYTQEEWDAETAFMTARDDRQKAERFERDRARLDAEYDALPQVFKDRIDRFRGNNPTFRPDFESYEMFVCTEAVKLAERAREAVAAGDYADEVEAFWADTEKVKLAEFDAAPESPELRWLFWAWALHTKAFEYDYEKHKAVTGIADGHSGNTAGAAISLARIYIEAPEYVAQKHGALSPLVGSKAYGDVPVGAK